MQCPFCKHEVQSLDGHCPGCRTALGAASADQIEATQTRMQAVMPRVRETATVTVMQPVQKPSGARARFRPRLRPPMLVLCAWDDGGEEGHWTRVYGDRLVIGRNEGDLQFPHEAAMSSPHAEIVREPAEGHWVWKLRDLESTNGTFVRVDRTALNHGQVLLIGSGRYRFKGVAQGGQQAEAPAELQDGRTQQWQMPNREDLTPMLVQLTPEGEAAEFFLEAKEQWIGTDAAVCQCAVPGDLLLDPCHAHIHQTGRERWAIEDHESTNGTWSMVQEIAIDESLQFQIGEQRFLARIP
jgi:hypothetical protein